MSNPAQVLSRHRKTPLPPVVPARQIVTWTNGNQNGRFYFEIEFTNLSNRNLFLLNKFDEIKKICIAYVYIVNRKYMMMIIGKRSDTCI